MKSIHYHGAGSFIHVVNLDYGLNKKRPLGSFWQLSGTGVAYIFNRRSGFGLSLDVINLACWIRCAADIGSRWVSFGRPLYFLCQAGYHSD